jgi:RNA polymerase sigma-70 factor (ECF subfamily)
MTELAATPSAVDQRAGLVGRAQGGDHAAFDALIRPKLEGHVRFALSLTGNEADARDIVQETCLRAWRELPRLRDAARFDSWMTQILVNVARTHLRSRRRVVVKEVPGDRSGWEHREDRVAASVEMIPEADAIRRAFARLDPAQRTLLVLHHVEGRSIEDIARALGIPEGTVKWRLHSARAALDRALEVEAR